MSRTKAEHNKCEENRLAIKVPKVKVPYPNPKRAIHASSLTRNSPLNARNQQKRATPQPWPAAMGPFSLRSVLGDLCHGYGLWG